MQTYLEEIVENMDPKGKIRREQHRLLTDVLEVVTDNRFLKVVCLLSEASMQIREMDVHEQVLSGKLIHNIVHNIGEFTEPSVAAMFERDLFDIDQH